MNSFQWLGHTLLNMLNGRLDEELSRRYMCEFEELIERQQHANPWHTPSFVRRALTEIANCLIAQNREVVAFAAEKSQRVAVIHDGIVPLDGFETLVSILLSGHQYVGKLSENDKRLIPFLCKMLIDKDAQWNERISFTDRLAHFDFVIFSDQGNNALNEYLKRHRHCQHQQQFAVAVLDGKETPAELSALCDDMLLYFGQGNFAVKKIFVPENYNFAPLFEMLNAHFPEMASHHHYLNNLEYQKTLLLLNQIPFLDSGIMAFVEDESLEVPVAVAHTEHYTSLENLYPKLDRDKGKISRLVTHLPNMKGKPFGLSHQWEMLGVTI